MASKLRFGTRERIDYRAGKHVVIRRTHLSYDRLMQLCDAESQARADYIRAQIKDCRK